MNITASRGEHASLEHDDFQIQVADTSAWRDQCNKLVNAMYSWRGYGPQDDAPASSPYKQTLVALRHEHVIGTLTICRDSASGIPADALYKSHIDAFRRRGASVCEITRLAIDPAHRSKDLLEGLFYHAYVYAGICGGATDAFIEVNPRHVPFYKRLLKFEQIGEEKICERVSAPAILLHRHGASVAQQVAECREQARGSAESRRPHLLLGAARHRTAHHQTALAA